MTPVILLSGLSFIILLYIISEFIIIIYRFIIISELVIMINIKLYFDAHVSLIRFQFIIFLLAKKKFDNN